MSRLLIEPTDEKVFLNFGDSRSKRSQDIRLALFVKNDEDAVVGRSSHKGKTPKTNRMSQVGSQLMSIPLGRQNVLPLFTDGHQSRHRQQVTTRKKTNAKDAV